MDERVKLHPRLQQLMATNSSEAVESCTVKAFGLLPDTAAAITELSRLKAVGPATASGGCYSYKLTPEDCFEGVPNIILRDTTISIKMKIFFNIFNDLSCDVVFLKQ